MLPNDQDDYWTNKTSAPAGDATGVGAKTSLKVENLGEIPPLGDQFDLSDPKTVPDELADWIFGTPPGAQEDDLHSAPAGTLHTYAILDAAKAVNLVERLATSSLEHACLFQGKTQEALGQVAPWIVKLDDKSPFTRSLFSAETGPTDLWDTHAGIFLRSTAPLAGLVKHFRKFTKLPDKQGTYLFLRFWEPAPFGDFCVGNQTPAPLAKAFFDAGGHGILYLGQSDGIVWSARRSGNVTPTPNARLTLTDEDKALFSQRVRARFAADLKTKVGTRAVSKGYDFTDKELSFEAKRTTAFVFWHSGPDSASLQDASKLMFVLLFLGEEAGQAILDGAVMRNQNLSMGQRIDMTARSYTTAIKRMATGKAL